MILIHIISGNKQQAIEIADSLVEEKLMLNAVILEEVAVRKKGDDGQIHHESQTLVMGKTKALLFDTIDKKLRDEYKEHMPVLYSLPIVNMDWKQADELVKETRKI